MSILNACSDASILGFNYEPGYSNHAYGRFEWGKRVNGWIVFLCFDDGGYTRGGPDMWSCCAYAPGADLDRRPTYEVNGCSTAGVAYKIVLEQMEKQGRE